MYIAQQVYGAPSSIAPDRYKDYQWELFIELTLAMFGIIVNVVSVHILLALDKDGRNTMTFFPLNVALCTVDMGYLITRFMAIISILYYKGYYGGDSGATCSISAFSVGLCAMWSISIVVGISYVAKHNLYRERKMSDKEMYEWVAISGICSLVLSLACAYVPDGGYVVDSSGTFCFLKLYSYSSATIYFGVGLSVTYGCLLRNLIMIYRAVQKSQQILKEHSIEGYAKAQYVKMVVKLSYFYIGINISFLPILINFIYEVSTQKYIDPSYSAFSAFFATINPSIVNPFLLFYLNFNVRDQYRKKYSIFYSESMSNIYKYRTVNIMDRTTRVGSILPTSSIHDMKNWINDPHLWSLFMEYGKKQHVLENFLFYDEVRRYRALSNEITNLIQNQSWHNVQERWDELERHAGRIYSIYIKVKLTVNFV